MSDSCFKINALAIPGTRQDERAAKALDQDYVRPDERSLEELMVFIGCYASLLRYYQWDGADQQDYKVKGTWEPLIMSGEAFQYAGISVTPAHLPNVSFYRWAARYEKESTRQKRFAAWRVMWDILFSIYRDVDILYRNLPTAMPLRTIIGSEIMHHLTAGFMNAAARYLNASEPAMVPDILPEGAPAQADKYQLYKPTPPDDDAYKFGYAKEILGNGFSAIWIHPLSGITSWTGYAAWLDAKHTEAGFDPTLGFIPDFYGDTNLTGFDRIDYATLHIRQLFEQAFGVYNRIIQAASDLLQQTLTQKHDHQPHHALLLTFLRLFGRLQADLNSFTQKHTAHYYERVLQVKPHGPAGDSVHVWMQPAKNVDTHLLKKGARLQAGKDAGGNLLFYDTTDDLTVSQVEVGGLKTLFRQAATGALPGKVFASADAATTDGMGKAPLLENWNAFADRRVDLLTGEEVNRANIGFCLATPLLHLVNGRRVITLTFTTDSAGYTKTGAWTVNDLQSALRIHFTGAEGWNSLQPDAANFNFSRQAPNKFIFTITLAEDFPAVAGLDKKVISDTITTVFPVMRISLDQSAGGEYELLKEIAIQRIDMVVTVSNMTAISVQSSLGKLDPSGPIQPFGPAPTIGSVFYVGHPELAHKKITGFSIKINWDDFNGDLKGHYDYKEANTLKNYINITSNSDFKLFAELLRNNQWLPSVNTSQSFITNAQTTISKSALNIPSATIIPSVFDESLADWDVRSRDGFIRLRLAEPARAFGHKVWPTVFAKQTIASNPPTAQNTLPNAPYVPVIQGISLEYTASQSLLWSNTDDGRLQFFHQMPFGYRQVTANALLLPVFEAEIKNQDGTREFRPVQAAWYIGVKGAVALRQLSLLLQMLEGSEDISVNTPVVHWNYLSLAGWRHFGDHWQADDTDGLLHAGIVRFIVPPDADLNSTELPAGMLWVKAWVENNAAGLPQAVAVHTNAVKAGLVNSNIHSYHFESPLAAGEVKRLFVPDALIKKVNQPYPSFGGRAAEGGSTFYTRVSERLRHKNRAVTIWDYERLVLQQFPDVYLVKCLNHTGYACGKGEDLPVYRENLPGQLMLVPLPFASRVQPAQRFQPVFSQAMLSRIKAFIRGDDAASTCKPFTRALHTRLARLHVENPRYEIITIRCDVRIKDCLDPFMYREKLHEDLNIFLAPWLAGGSAALRFGGSLHVSLVVYFMEQLNYVDHVEQVTLLHQPAGSNEILNASDPDLATATTSRSVLTTSDSHTINLLNT